MDKELYTELCKHVGWVDPPEFGKCVPTQQGPKRDNKQDEKSTAPIRILQLCTGYKIPKKESITAPTDIEEGEIITSDDNTPQP